MSMRRSPILVMQIQSVMESNIKNMDRDSLAGIIADILNKQIGSPPPNQKVRECFINLIFT